MLFASSMTNKVGVAPGTTTFSLDDASCPADIARGNPAAAVDLSWLLKPPPANVVLNPTTQPYERPPLPTSNVADRVSNVASRVVKALSPYGSFENMEGARRRGLGLVLSPYGDISPRMYSEISATYQNYRNHCGPFDPQFNTKGEAGYYYDSPLGGNGPTDFQVARAIGYMPVVNSWVPFQQETWTMAPWVPPNGGGAYGTIGPPYRSMLRGQRRGWLAALKSSILGAADGGEVVDAVNALPYDAGRAAVTELQRHQDRVFILSAVSTVAVAGGFLLNVIKDRREKNRLRKTSSYENPSTVPVAGARRRKRKR